MATNYCWEVPHLTLYYRVPHTLFYFHISIFYRQIFSVSIDMHKGRFTTSARTSCTSFGGPIRSSVRKNFSSSPSSSSCFSSPNDLCHPRHLHHPHHPLLHPLYTLLHPVTPLLPPVTPYYPLLHPCYTLLQLPCPLLPSLSTLLHPCYTPVIPCYIHVTPALHGCQIQIFVSLTCQSLLLLHKIMD